MYDVINTLLWVALAANLGNSSTTQNQVRQNQPVIPVESRAEYQDNQILSKDSAIAKKALDKAIIERDEATIRIGLKNCSMPFKKDIVQGVKNAYYQSFIPDLIAALEETQVSNTAKENIAEQQELKKTVVSALMHLTGLRFPNTEELNAKDIQTIQAESREWYRANETEIQQSAVADVLDRQQTTPILSKASNVAKTALDKAVSEKDESTIRLGLQRNSLSFRTAVVQAIKKLDDKSFVPDLIKTLEDNQSIMSGGSETQAEQQELNREIISTLKQLTGLEFSYLTDESVVPCFSDCPSKDIQRVLKESRDWWKANKKNYGNTKGEKQ